MKKDMFKRLALFFLIVTLGISNVMSVKAENLKNIINDTEMTETDANYAEDTTYSLLRGNNLNYGTSSIGKVSSMEVEIYGITQCHKECDEVYLELYLERKEDGVYSTYKYWQFKDYNVSSLSRDITVLVPSGYYYRVRGYHAAKDGSKEATTTLTQGILVN